MVQILQKYSRKLEHLNYRSLNYGVTGAPESFEVSSMRTFVTTFVTLLWHSCHIHRDILRGLQCRVSDFYRWYLILVIRLRRFRIFFQNASSVIRSRARILPIIGGESFSQKRETGTKRGWSTYFIYFCPGMGKDPPYLYFHGWWPYNVAQQVIFSTQVDSNNRITGK